MGSTTYNPRDWDAYSASTTYKTREEIFTSHSMSPKLDPKNIKFRESRDSAANPNSTPAIVGVDVTGSMGMLAETIAKKSLGPMFKEIYARKPISDPHLMFMGIGDSAAGDRAPLQVSQFEAGHKEIAEQLELLWLEGGGGGNRGESYSLAWYFAARKTVHDSWEKRGKKGFLFTLGDEPPLLTLTPAEVKRVFGDTIQAPLSAQELYDMASKTYEIYHLMVMQGDHARRDPLGVVNSWTSLIGERARKLTDVKDMAEVIVSILEVVGGKDADLVTSSWSGSTAITVREAVKGLKSNKGKISNSGAVRF